VERGKIRRRPSALTPPLLKFLSMPRPFPNCETAFRPQNGGFVPDFVRGQSFVINRIGGFVFQKPSAFSRHRQVRARHQTFAVIGIPRPGQTPNRRISAPAAAAETPSQSSAHLLPLLYLLISSRHRPVVRRRGNRHFWQEAWHSAPSWAFRQVSGFAVHGPVGVLRRLAAPTETNASVRVGDLRSTNNVLN